MPRIRSIKPEHWGDKYLPNISLGAHLTWISMWNFSDDKGIIECDYHLIKANTFPRRKEIKPSQIEKWVKELIKYGFVIPFEHKHIQYLIHRTFDVHQKIDRPQPSKISDDVIRRVFDEYSTNEQRTFDDDSVTIRRKDRIGEDMEGKGMDRIVAPDPPIFKLKDIYEKKFEELNGAFKELTQVGFEKWKKFVDFVVKKNFTDLFRCKFIRPQDFEKIDFPESKWEDVLKSILATGVKEEHDLLYRIPQFLKYTEKNGLNSIKGGSQSKGGELSGTSVIAADKEYKGRLGH